MIYEAHPEQTHLCGTTAVTFRHQQVRGPLVLSISPIESRNQRRKHLLPGNPSGRQDEIHVLDTVVWRAGQARACALTRELAVYLFLNSLTKLEKDGPPFNRLCSPSAVDDDEPPLRRTVCLRSRRLSLGLGCRARFIPRLHNDSGIHGGATFLLFRTIAYPWLPRGRARIGLTGAHCWEKRGSCRGITRN